MIPALAIALASLGTDTPIEPIPDEFINVEVIQELCGGYQMATTLIVAFGIETGDDPETMIEMLDAWAVWSWEIGWDETGNARMTSEARTLFVDTLHQC